MARILLDTNVLVYAFDVNDVARQDRALNVLSALEVAEAGYLSAQALAEFANVAPRKLQPPLSQAEVVQALEQFTHAFPVFDLTAAVVLEASRGVRDYRLAHYDAQVWATAKLNQVPVIFSEDFDTGKTLEGVRFVNPFARDFSLKKWV